MANIDICSNCPNLYLKELVDEAESSEGPLTKKALDLVTDILGLECRGPLEDLDSPYDDCGRGYNHAKAAETILRKTMGVERADNLTRVS